jgi:hypothetical protein
MILLPKHVARTIMIQQIMFVDHVIQHVLPVLDLYLLTA